ncbi:MAG: RdgB/HAM1 family non-canonical purine NTP pyrophosphatase [Ardenticatenaceae bacterium]|nr:RdgB/HAM1 family non-canonical purine NTP pyrophosphatase [Ardenticatenaceae bacterium]
MKLLIATRNQGKVKELAEMMANLGVEWLSLSDVNIDFDVDETGSTFVENATLKAEAYARASGMITLADDSGLEVAALGGAPGIYTARYGSAGMSHEERFQFLLQNLVDVPPEKRRAQFRAVIVVADPEGQVLTTSEGICPGAIALAPRGTNGFGYDPIFLPDGQNGRTMAELQPEEKHLISHRGRAIAKLAPRLAELLSLTQS